MIDKLNNSELPTTEDNVREYCLLINNNFGKEIFKEATNEFNRQLDKRTQITPWTDTLNAIREYLAEIGYEDVVKKTDNAILPTFRKCLKEKVPYGNSDITFREYLLKVPPVPSRFSN